MALLHMLSEEEILDESLDEYAEDLYKVVCIGERPASLDAPGAILRTTYLVDWEQLVHLLEDYGGFGEDIVEVTPVAGSEARLLRTYLGGVLTLARA